MINKVISLIEEYQMFQKGDRVVVGVSGGADSVALLHCLSKGIEQLELQVAVCHINHQLRGEESDRDEKFVRQLCQQFSLPCHVLSQDVGALAKKWGIGIEECGRKLRYRFFQETADLYGENTKIATAHTLSDQAETVLFRLARGTGLKGLCGIPPVREGIVRPLLGVTRVEVENYCVEQGLDYVKDSSNTSVDYARNRIRLNVVPQLEIINPSFLRTLGGIVEDFREDDHFLWEEAVNRLGEAHDGESGYKTACLMEQPGAMRSRMLMLICQENLFLVDRKKLRELDQIIRENHGKINMTAGRYAVVSSGKLSFKDGREEPAPYFEIPLKTGVLTFPSGNAYNINIVDQNELEKINRNFATDILDCDKILGKVIIRQRRSGDRISMPRRGVTKSVKKLYNEAGIPLDMRGKLAVFSDSQGLIWAEGFGVDRRAMPGPETKRFLVIYKIEQD